MALASIIVHGANDGYMHNFLWRCSTVLNKQAAMLTELGEHDVELILVDWGSESRLLDGLPLTDDCRQRLRHFQVPTGIARQVSNGSRYSSSHATNVGVRRATGKYIIVCDADTYWQTPTMVELLASLRRGCIGDKPLSSHFFWASRKHVPKSFHMNCPPLGELDAYIDANHQWFIHDMLNRDQFLGTGLALTCERDMWVAARGFDERLVHWGWNDIHFHRRLQLRYAWGGDLCDHGMQFYHLEHYACRDVVGENLAKANPQIPADAFESNDENWGLAGLQL